MAPIFFKKKMKHFMYIETGNLVDELIECLHKLVARRVIDDAVYLGDIQTILVLT